MPLVQPVPKPMGRRQIHPDISREQRERIWGRSRGRCECCGRPMGRYSMLDWPELHHIIPKGMGGTSKVYEDHELMYLRLECHDREEAAGYPHRYSWVEDMRLKGEG